MIDPDYYFTHPDFWDDGDRAYDAYLDAIADLADGDDPGIDWDFEPTEIEDDRLDFDLWIDVD